MSVLTTDVIKFLFKMENQIKEIKNYKKLCLMSELDNTDGCASWAVFSFT